MHEYICFLLILSPIKNLSLNLLCRKHEEITTFKRGHCIGARLKKTIQSIRFTFSGNLGGTRCHFKTSNSDRTRYFKSLQLASLDSTAGIGLKQIALTWNLEFLLFQTKARTREIHEKAGSRNYNVQFVCVTSLIRKP